MTLDQASRLRRYESAFAELDAPFAFVDLDAMWSNSADMLRRAGGTPIRVASKSLRCRALTRAILDRDSGYRGLLSFTLPEALWLAGHGYDDIVVAYPTTDRGALRELAATAAGSSPILMVDSVEHLDLIGAAVGPVSEPLRVCIDFDASLWLVGDRIRIGPKRTPLHTPADARRLGAEIASRSFLELAGLMCYEGHIAGQGDSIAGNPAKSAMIRRIQRTSYDELRERRAAAVAAVSEVATLQFVNAGGTGDLERVATEPSITEATAGSGFYAPTLFDNYRSFTLQPAAIFALPVCRRPGPGTVTALGGGYLASGVGGKDRMPRPYLPAGLRLDAFEGAGEVQTPLLGAAADRLRVGDNVYFRHTKAGELCERFDRLYLVAGDRIVDEVATYRGEGRTFL
ncbi:MAG TPA: amino acid deaminase/aldolase [Solirubrobacteraceae bacterium]|nr:amino acid deaminase/aldolase [Solirubrobacteraceae bacterium]